MPNEFRINPLPDLLADHTLVSSDQAGRLNEYLVKWSHFVSGLWWQCDKVTYYLRYRRDRSRLSIDLTISVSADDPSDQKKADEHLLLLLGINRLPVEPFECRDEASNCVIKEVRQRLEKFWYRPVDEEVSDDENRN